MDRSRKDDNKVRLPTWLSPAAPHFRRNLLVTFLVLALGAWMLRHVSGFEECPGGCVRIEEVAKAPDADLDAARRIEPFSDEDITKMTIDDGDDGDGDTDEVPETPPTPETDSLDEELRKQLDAEKTKIDADGDKSIETDPNKDGESSGGGDDVFRPLLEGTLGYAMKHYKSSLDMLMETRMKISDEDVASIPTDDGIHVITTFFHGTYHDKRFKEIMATLVSNLENPYITAMHVLWQGSDPRFFIPDEIAQKIVQLNLHKKLVLTEVKKQPTYKVMFSYANEKLKRGAVVIVTNADIYYDSSLRCVSMPPKNYTTLYYQPEKIKTRVAFALSRRHSPECKGKPDHRSFFDLCEDYTLSHDAFVFAVPVPRSIVMRTDHTQNQGYGAENIVIFEFKRENYKVINPCYTIKGYHLHCVNERHYVVAFVNRSPPRPGSSWPVARKCGLWVY